ncbi:NFX1-type zinc finger-containing protein 1 [Leucoagaricus sp. SymC.cos]|nr:NFX1-type zinc finger-containing protein 1 [Leucoagaricus sp. SymC.cos]
MSQRQARCKLFNTSNGCRFGDRCRFSHVDGGTNSSRTSLSPAPSPARTTVPQSPRPPNRGPNGVPRNVCQYFWTTGACARGFECSYRHIKQAAGSQSQAADSEVTAGDDEDGGTDFFSPEGLAIGAGSVREDRHNLNPSEVHNHLKDFLRDNYPLDTAAQVTGFVRVLASVNDRNKAWNTASAQEFLEVVVKGNALHRIGDVLRFEPVDISIGFHTGALSFQKGYFPIFQFFASDLVLKSTLHNNINVLYAIIKNNHDHIFATLQTCIKGMMTAKSWKDPTPNLTPTMQNTLDGLTIFRTLTTTFLQYFQRYKDAIRSHSDVPGFAWQFAEWFNIWYFWTTGACARGFECSYRHIKQAAGSQSQAADSEVTAGDDEDGGTDFFSPEGLAIGAGSVREDRHNLNPSEVHNHLKDFLRDNYPLDTAAQVTGFVRVLASVNDRNKAWNTASAQEFLEVVVKGNALHRIGDVLRFEPVDISIGFHTGALSFQKGYFPIFQFFASDLVLKSTLHNNINVLYAIIKNNHDHIFATLQTCIKGMMTAKSWKDPTPNLTPTMQNTLDGLTIFRTLTTTFLQYFQRYKDAIRSHSDVPGFAWQFAEWFNIWVSDVSATPARFQDTITSVSATQRKLTIDHITGEIDRLLAIVERESGVVLRLSKAQTKSTVTHAQRSQARIAQLAQTYEPPGELRANGARHDNDFELIEKIRIAPTHSELFSPVAPYMPVFSPDAPHHLLAGSMERHLDIQFRLLREELISTTRASVTAIHDDLLRKWEGRRKKSEKTKLESLLDQKGGPYRTSGRDSLFFHVYTNAEFLAGPPEARRNGVTVTLVLDAPPAPAAHDKDAKARFAYWEHNRRLQGSSLVALIIVSNLTVQVYLGIITSFGQDIAESAKLEKGRIQLRVSFFDSEVEFMALRGERLNFSKERFAVLVDNSVMFESVRPFLQKLQTIEPTEIPFSRYIAHGGSLEGVQVLPPKYARAPAFTFNLQCLAKPGMNIAPLNVSMPLAVVRARDQLKRLSVLDPSQAEAVVDTLTREVSLIQGPPGTGKACDAVSYTAKEILRVLFTSKIRPIVLIAFTNHALDHMVSSVLDAKITEKIVRLGTRSSDERIQEYTLDKLERLATAPTLDRSMRRQYGVMKRLEEDMEETMTSIRLPLLSWEEIERYLDIHHSDHAEMFREPPYWIQALADLKWQEEEKQGEFKEVKRKKRGKKEMIVESDTLSKTLYGFWRQGLDLQFIQQEPSAPPKQQKGRQRADADTDTEASAMLLTNPAAFFTSLGFGEGQMPPVPSNNRQLANLLLSYANVWSMSIPERQRLADEWERRIRSLAYNSKLDQYTRLKDEYKEACKEYDDMRNEVRRRILSNTDLIACTTTGAASLTSLLSSIAPRVLMVEEAGQVLEAHILASLVSSVHHLICIGDPLQLRPSLATYALSVESAIGNELYKFDRSLMERLSDSQFPMSQINVQRRMRPSISHFIRTILYPKLEDNEVVHKYPAVQGMQKNVFFFNHLNKENGTEDSVSKFNTFEVEMIRDLVVYFLHQGTYDGAGDIAVLCAYLGQLQKVRAALRNLKIAVTVNERDAEQLARQGIEEDVEYEEVVVARHVRLGTVDIFQGQEAKIVIVSLVRNSGQIDTGSASIGFLKSPNRINVALSRAKHGLYVLGNAANLRQNPTWSTILDEMEAEDQVGPAFPIICPRHPEKTRLVSKPGDIPIHAPSGGCTLPCDARLSCGHICPSVCHSALDNHRSTRCMAPCNRTPCPRKHPCSKRCSDDCGDCEFPMYKVALPCGHIAAKVPCHLLEDLGSIKCHERVRKRLPGCEHTAITACHRDPSSVRCLEPCGQPLQCCTKTCKSACSSCRSLTIHHTASQTTGRIARSHHTAHPCERMLYCEHKCGLDCHPKDQNCNPSCQQTCRQQCVHHKCPKPCSEPCSPCMEPCTWSCAHLSCPVLCGSICSRLPCDEPCEKTLKCRHPCPSVCGEICAEQKCIVCLPEDQKQDIVDFIMQRRLVEIDLASTDVSERLITLACGHIFTVETLDGHCNMSAFYEIDAMGQFLSTKSPPVNYQTPPTCPTCRGPITALRYGRVTKRATLDILEQNVAGTMSHNLDDCNPAITEFTSNMPTAQEQVKKLVIQSNGDSTSERKSGEPSYVDVHGPLLEHALNQDGMQKVHGIALEEARAWYKIVKPIVVVYRRIWKVATTRGAHVKAYEAALTTLYRLELQAIADDPERVTNTPEPLALVIVDKKIGQPPPKADVRFQIEAYFLTLEIRVLIAQLAQARVEALPLTATATNPDAMQHRGLWAAFVTFLYKSCIVDADKAIVLATQSSASRQVARASIHKLRFEFELFRWETMTQRLEMITKNSFDVDARDELSAKVKNYKYLMLQSYELVEKAYFENLPSKFKLADLIEEHKWLNKNCQKKVNAWRNECVKLEESIRKGELYQPMSTQEFEDIVRSFNFNELSAKVKKYRHLMLQSYELVQKAYFKSLPLKFKLRDLMEEHKWLRENCQKKVNAWCDECVKLEESIRKGELYQPMSTQELEDIVRSFDFTNRGHFYNCRNGHTFVITECGGAMESARCPECKAPIGGSDHQIDSSNTRNMELEAISQRQGAAASPWGWGRGA